ncbi:D-alanyl-D-alanine carboxypeptidase/D-alanyl-D-alanine endopeptidase [Zafaria sp. Z1313]|uniref:D-alanyl-D-alanine carboxypeptidase/D-alanyl-D-alanine endopeptidase n=1 Tax=unclassified Zafaria TaxID=2828765 RepID=UPI002E79AF95|nr:D-alanyl-D-alanine carboxypeptidase/D-alanyl-D-alanine-endopeptidase [Zafaria sp. J156]MEE1621410.1 D-alanyl-D-alanine carboxypeptidase/D-alanyl-D-alanine-endopeptidase [Zafaria sp. J156]
MNRGMRALTSALLVLVVGGLVGLLALNLLPQLAPGLVAGLGAPAEVSEEPAAPSPVLPTASPTAVPLLDDDAPAPDPQVLARALAPLLEDAEDMAFAASVADAATGEVLYSHDADRLGVPASSLKVLTAAAALDVLGPARTLTTRTVAGAGDTVVLVGGGDVLLGAGESTTDDAGAGTVGLRRAGLATLAERTAEALLDADAASGGPAADPASYTVVLDDTLFSGLELSPTWDVSLLTSFNISRVAPIALYGARRDGAEGSPRVEDPAMTAAEAFRDALAAALARLHAERAEASAEATARASAAPTPSGTAAVPTDGAAPASSSPSSESASPRAADAATGPGPAPAVAAEVVRGAAAPDARELGAVESAPLLEQLRFLSEESDNYAAEAMGRLVAIGSGDPASFGGAAEALKDAAARLGADTSGMSLADSSGLSAANRVSPRQLVEVLAGAAGSPKPALRELGYLLPVAGASGTLEERMTGDATRGLVRAKTGTLAGVATLTGTVLTQDGRLLAFSFFGHSIPGDLGPARAAMDRAAAILAGCGCR